MKSNNWPTFLALTFQDFDLNVFVFYLWIGNSGGVTPIRIVLDESVIPRRYARVLMQALYLDSVDLNCIVRSGYSASVGQEDANTATSGGAAAATVLPAPRLPTLFEEATELYQVISICHLLNKIQENILNLEKCKINAWRFWRYFFIIHIFNILRQNREGEIWKQQNLKCNSFKMRRSITFIK